MQAKLNDQRNNQTVARAKSEALLIGRIYDDRGNRMTPSHVRKGGIKYRYYLSSSLLHGQPGRAGSVRRVPAAEVEALVASAVRGHIEDSTERDDRDLIGNYVVRVEVQADQLMIELKANQDKGQPRGRGNGTSPSHQSNQLTEDRTVLFIPWRKTPSKRRREIIVPKSPAPQDARPIRAETRVKLIASIARGRRWLDEIASGKVTDVEQIAAREKCSIRKVNMTISLAFLAPESGQSRRRRSSAARDWSCSSLRRSGRVVASVPDTRPSKSVSRRYPAYRRKLLPLLVVAIASTKA